MGAALLHLATIPLPAGAMPPCEPRPWRQSSSTQRPPCPVHHHRRELQAAPKLCSIPSPLRQFPLLGPASLSRSLAAEKAMDGPKDHVIALFRREPASPTGALPAPPEELIVAPFPASRSSSPRGLLQAMSCQASSSPATSFVGTGRDQPDLLFPASIRRFLAGVHAKSGRRPASASCAASPVSACERGRRCAPPTCVDRGRARSDLASVLAPVGHSKAQPRPASSSSNRPMRPASVSFRSCEDSFDYVCFSSSWTRSSSERDFRF